MSSVQIFLFAIATIAMYPSTKGIDTIRAFNNNVHVPAECWNLLKRKTDKNNHSYPNFCHQVPSNYPYKEVAEALSEKQEIDFHATYSPEDEPPYTKDLCDGEMNKNCCSSSTWTIPYFIRSESKLKMVLHTNFFTQRIKTTQCVDVGATCFKDFDIVSTKLMEATCKTNMGSTKLYVFDPATNKIEFVSAEFPVSCSCHVNKIKHYL